VLQFYYEIDGAAQRATAFHGSVFSSPSMSFSFFCINGTATVHLEASSTVFLREHAD
jgi:hypothetical protein